MPKLMSDLKWRETSGVDRAANLAEGWLMMKSVDPKSAELLASAEALAKGIDPSTLSGRTPTMSFDKEALAKSDPAAVAYIEGLEKALAGIGKTPALTEPTEAEILAKSLEDLPEPVRKALADGQRRAAEAEEIAKGLLVERERGEYMAKAATFAHIPGVNPAEFGETMRKAAHGDKGAVAEVFEVLAKAEAALKVSKAFVEIGSNAPAAGSAEEGLASFAKSLQEKNPSMSEAEAIAKAAEANPDLYRQHRGEALRKNAGVGSGRED